MLRTALFRSSVAIARAATRQIPPRVGRRIAILPKPTTPSLAFGVAGRSTIRCYSAGGGLTKQDVFMRIAALLKGFDKVSKPENISETAHFANDLGLDSLDTVEVVMAIEEEFSIEIPDKEADQIHSVDKAVEYILSQPDAN